MFHELMGSADWLAIGKKREGEDQLQKRFLELGDWGENQSVMNYGASVMLVF